MAKLLLAEDEAALRMLVSDTLEDEGHELDIACDGEEALEKIAANDYDLVILDYMMPKYTGLDVIGRVRDMANKRDVAILMLSAKSQHMEQERILMAGADDFMAKPFSPMELARKVEAMTRG